VLTPKQKWLRAGIIVAAFGIVVLPIGVAVVSELASTPSGGPAVGNVNDFDFEAMHVDYLLDRAPDGTAHLTAVETLVALFPDIDQNRGIVRDIPAEYQRVDIGLQVVSVTDEDGRPIVYERSTFTDYDGIDFVSLSIDDDTFKHGRTTYVITWTARDVVGTFADTSIQEFFWDVNGTAWRQDFGSVTADLHLGAGLGDQLTGRTECYFGYEGSTDNCAFEAVADGFRMDAGPLFAYQNATIAVGFEPGTFRPGTPVDKTWPAVVLPWVLIGVLIAAGGVAILFRRVLWIHAPGRGIIVPEYEGPEELGVMAAALLLKRPAGALPAQLVKLAVDDVVRLVEDPAEPEHRRFRLDVLDVAAAVSPSDDRALRKLFGKKVRDGASLVLDRRDRKLGDRVATMMGQARSDLRPEYLSRGEKSRLSRLITWPALAVLAGAIGLAVWCGIQDVGSLLLTITIPLVIVGSFVVMGFSGKPERRTAQGTLAFEQLLGLRDYLQLAEADRLQVLQSPEGAERTRVDPNDSAAVVKLYERLLPWAIVWGVEKEWGQVLEDRYAETPSATDNLSFASGFAGVSILGSSFAASSFATTPPVSSSSSGSGFSSSSSGSSGGGSSGGGGGGGGGGGR
jgi:uncharacterized membrane protein YgcG